MTHEELHALVKAWNDEEPGAGMALYDAMEEAGWPWEWRGRDDHPYSIIVLYFPGMGDIGFSASQGERHSYSWSVYERPQRLQRVGDFGKTAFDPNTKWPPEEERKRLCEEKLKEILRNS